MGAMFNLRVGFILLIATYLFTAISVHAAAGNQDNVTNGVIAEGYCAVVGMSPEQCQLTALQRARAAAIEQAVGVHVASTTLVTDAKLTLDFIKTYSRGFIVKEKIEWLPMGQYQKDSTTAPIPEYRVKTISTVRIPDPKRKPLGLQAKTSASVYRSGESAWVEVKTSRPARIGIFNITADDRVVLLFPNDNDHDNLVNRSEPFRYPNKKSLAELEMQVIPGHLSDAEAFFFVAIDADHPVKLEDRFTPLQSLPLTDFFARYAEFADYGEDSVIAYEVVER